MEVHSTNSGYSNPSSSLKPTNNLRDEFESKRKHVTCPRCDRVGTFSLNDSSATSVHVRCNKPDCKFQTSGRPLRELLSQTLDFPPTTPRDHNEFLAQSFKGQRMTLKCSKCFARGTWVLNGNSPSGCPIVKCKSCLTKFSGRNLQSLLSLPANNMEDSQSQCVSSIPAPLLLQAHHILSKPTKSVTRPHCHS